VSTPRVSVLMLTFNRPQYISRAIESVIAQQFEDWELLVVHDGDLAEIGETVRRLAEREPRIRYLHRQEVGNIAEANNYGLEQAGGDYIAIMDDDDYWIDPEKLSRQVAFLDEHRDYVACSAGVIVVGEDGAEQMRMLKPERDQDIRRHILYANPLVHSVSMFRRVVDGTPVRYDATLAGFQDWDLWLRLGQCGKFYNFPEYFACYQVWGGGGTFHQSKKNTRSALRIVWRHRTAYPGFPGALSLALLYYSYAQLPLPVRRLSYTSLARLKRTVFSHRPATQKAQ
jgi:glycosyltransferase involved in cell wall biosynthesis